MEIKEPSYTIRKNINWCSHCGEQYGSSFKKLKTDLLYDLTILSWIYIQRKLIRKDPSTIMFIAALFTIVKIWKQSKCLSTGEWISKM